MLKLQENERELVEEFRELAEELKYMTSYARTEDTSRVMSELKQAFIDTTNSLIEHDEEEFNNNWYELKYLLVDLENAISEAQDIADERGRKAPNLTKLHKSLMSIHNYEEWNIDRLTNQPIVY